MINHYVRTYESARRTIDNGLQRYMVKVYAHLASALLLTTLAAAVTVLYAPLTRLLFTCDAYGCRVGYTGLGWVVVFLPVGIAMYIRSKGDAISFTRSRLLLTIYAVLTGMSLSTLAFYYSIGSLYKTFLVAASTFGCTSVYGYVTNRDLSQVGSFCRMAIWGLIISSLVNLFFQSSAIDFAISFVGVGVFTFFVAYYTQQLKSLYYEIQDSALAERAALMGAFLLYLNFLNIFIYLLRFFGERRRRD
ncbi:Bax inhibitor-1/YccA family protein [Candidatus Cardinium hertigii]|uniref:Inner membrane protein YbhL n=1 Tax=Candidatus Cardinium hertigii TaxID=247481 RepID=A0A2Z3LF62_9BACT|nr:Bax inhibitor-1/YccA family protein [Candidatus Cardinium hertigii]AWN82316.1 Inner membrane protein YbhL [Candidatus Cardinium hertigii]